LLSVSILVVVDQPLEGLSKLILFWVFWGLLPLLSSWILVVVDQPLEVDLRGKILQKIGLLDIGCSGSASRSFRLLRSGVWKGQLLDIGCSGSASRRFQILSSLFFTSTISSAWILVVVDQPLEETLKVYETANGDEPGYWL